MVIFFAIKAFQFVRIARNPLVRALPRGAQISATRFFAKDVAKGVLLRAPGQFLVGIILSPFNVLAIASGDRLITTGEAAARVVSLDFREPGKIGAAVVFATPDFALDLGIEIGKKAFQGVRAGTEMIVGLAEQVGIRRDRPGLSQLFSDLRALSS